MLYRTPKSSLTFHQRLSARELLENLIEYARQELEDDYKEWPENVLDVRNVNPVIKTRVRDFYRQAQIEKVEFHTLTDGSNQERIVVLLSVTIQENSNLNASDILAVYKLYTNGPETEETFEEFIKRCKLLWSIEPSDNYFRYAYSCPVFTQYGCCRHIIAFLVDKSMLVIPDEFSVVSSGRKRLLRN